MNIQHLNELIRVLENVNPIDFNLEEWIVTQADLEEAKEFNDDLLRHNTNNFKTQTIAEQCAVQWVGVSRPIFYRKWFNT